MRLCKLQMMHIPLGVPGNLIAQEFNQIIFVRRQGLWSNGGLEFLHITFCSEMGQSIQDWVFKWLHRCLKWQFINNWFSLLFLGLHYPKWLLGNDIHCLKYEYTKISWIRIQIHYQLKFDMPQAGYSCISMISQQLKKNLTVAEKTLKFSENLVDAPSK